MRRLGSGFMKHSYVVSLHHTSSWQLHGFNETGPSRHVLKCLKCCRTTVQYQLEDKTVVCMNKISTSFILFGWNLKISWSCPALSLKSFPSLQYMYYIVLFFSTVKKMYFYAMLLYTEAVFLCGYLYIYMYIYSKYYSYCRIL